MRRAVFLLILLTLIAGCGTKGALYLPDEKSRTDNSARR
jgi:predicted small lipoprotein YifL